MMITRKPVQRCVCAHMTFAEMKETHLDLAALMDVYDVGTNCGSCLPYIQRMLQTGETEFDILSCDLSD